MVTLIRKLDEITFLAKVKDRLFVVWEFENSLALWIHLQERKIALDMEQRKIECDI
jgi:hypothetical protein